MKGIELELVYFILLPYTQAMPKSKKLDFHENVDRSNTKSKVLGLVESADELIEICMHEQWLKTSENKVLTFFGQYFKLWNDLAFTFSMIINFLIFFSFSNEYGNRMTDIKLFSLASNDFNYTK